MLREVVPFLLRVALMVAISLLIWRSVQPKTQFRRVLRAALLLLTLLGVLAVVRITGT